MPDIQVPDFGANWINALDAGRQRGTQMRQQNALNYAGQAFAAGDYDAAENRLLQAGMPQEAGQYGELAQARRTRTAQRNIAAAGQNATGNPGQRARAMADAALAEGQTDQWAQMLDASRNWTQGQIQLAQQTAQLIASRAPALKQLPMEQRTAAAIQELQSIGADESAIERIRQLGADGLTDAEIDAETQGALSFAEQLTQRNNERDFNENVRQFNISNANDRERLNIMRAQAGGAGYRSPGYVAPTASETSGFNTAQQQLAQAGEGLESLREARGIIEQLISINQFGQPTPEVARREIGRLSGTNAQARALFERLSGETWNSVLENLEGLQPISEAELNEARTRVANGDWTADAALNWIRRMEERARRAQAHNNAQLQWGFENGSLTRGRNAQNQSYNDVRQGIDRTYDQWGALSGVRNPVDGREYVNPVTGDVFRYSATNRETPWTFSRAGETRSRDGRGVGSAYNPQQFAPRAPAGGWPQPSETDRQQLIERSHDPRAREIFDSTFGPGAAQRAMSQRTMQWRSEVTGFDRPYVY